MSRINLKDNILEMIKKLSEGNPGAMTALTEILKQKNEVGHQDIPGGFAELLCLDLWEIYGADIYVLFADKCGKDISKMLLLIRATQLGLFPETKLKEMAKDQERKVNLTEEEFKALNDKVV